MAFITRLTRRLGLTHRIRVGDGIVVLLSDPGAKMAPGDEVGITIQNMDQARVKVVIDAPKGAFPVYTDLENQKDQGAIEG